MSTQNQIQAHFTVAGQKLPVSHFSLVEALSTATELTLHFKLNAPGETKAWIGQPVSLSIEDQQGNTRDWHLICESATLESLTARSAWSRCYSSKPIQKVFCHAHLPDLIDSILMNHGLDLSYRSWHLSHEAWTRDQLVQCAETDGDFIARMMGRENIQFFARAQEGREVLHFMDHPRFLNSRKDPLIYYPRQTFQDAPGSRLGLFALEYKLRGVLQSHEWQDEMALRRYSGIPCMQAGISTQGMPVKSYLPLHYEPDHLKTRLRERQIQARDLQETGYRALRVQSNLLDLEPGMRTELASQLGFAQAQGIYHINYVKHDVRVTEGGEILLYENRAILQDAQSPWRGLLYPAPRMPLVFQAQVESAHDLTYLNANGQETVRSLLDSHSSERTKASIPLPRLTPYANPSGGMHFPLYPGAEVLMTCLHGEPDLPVILGSVYNTENLSPVNHLNPWVNIIRTEQNQTFIMDDTPAAPLISLATQSGHRWVMQHGDQPGIFVDCIGGMIFRSQGRQAWHTGEHYLTQSKNTYTQRALLGQKIQSINANIYFKAALNIKSHALRNILSEAGRNAQFSSRALDVKVEGDLSISVEGNAEMIVQGAERIQTNDVITISSLTGDIIFTHATGNCGMKLTQNGNIHLFGKQIFLNTDLQKNAATIRHRA